jgi:hypothetical protein
MAVSSGLPKLATVNDMTRRRNVIRIVAAVALVLVLAAVAAGFAIGAGGDDERPIEGKALARASAAALAHTGGGRVTATEIQDEDSFYEVEVTLDDGTQVDVQLDRSFAVVGDKADDERADDSDAG